VSAVTRNCPETATKLPGRGHENCPLLVMGSARHGPSPAANGRVRDHPDGAVEHADDGVWVGPVLGAARAAWGDGMRVKITEPLAPAKLFDPVEVDWALGHAAVHGRLSASATMRDQKV
jgi:hypothetical protein